MNIALCICHDDTGLDSLVPVKEILNATTCKDIIDNCVLPTVWQQFVEGSHMGVKVKCPHYFCLIMYILDVDQI